MKHLGDITKISGYTAPIVDCIIGGSPCQDLSVAGKRAGLDGERSGLYMEQIRTVKEMRERDERNGRSDVDIRPRYMVWENVPGAFSSNKGEDFRIVLEEIAKVCDKDAVIPMPDKGKWTNHGCIMGDGWSVAWRVLDAQFWGVPQRRRRIALVADFGGQSAPEILFVRKSVSGHSESSEQKRQETPSDASRGFGADDCIGVDIYNTALTGDKACPLTAEGHTSTGTCPKVMTPITFEPGIAAREGGHIYEGVSGTLRANAGDNQMAVAYGVTTKGNGDAFVSEERHTALSVGGGQAGQGYPCVCYGVDAYNQVLTGDKAKTLNSAASDADHIPCTVYSVENHPADSRVNLDESGKVQTLTSRMGTGGGNVPMVLALDRASFNQGKNAQFDFEISDKGVNSPLIAKGPGAVCYQATSDGDIAGTLDASYYKGCGVRMGRERTFVVAAVDARNATEDIVNGALQSNSAHSLNGNNVVRCHYIVRRFTPLECERLQGYPDGWTDIGEYVDSTGKKRQTSDAARYKALGNSIALPPWKWVLKRICACYERDATMASLFDGIGGFPYLWEQLNGKGTCLWASEIEEFPMAVTKVRVGE